MIGLRRESGFRVVYYQSTLGAEGATSPSTISKTPDTFNPARAGLTSEQAKQMQEEARDQVNRPDLDDLSTQTQNEATVLTNQVLDNPKDWFQLPEPQEISILSSQLNLDQPLPETNQTQLNNLPADPTGLTPQQLSPNLDSLQTNAGFDTEEVSPEIQASNISETIESIVNGTNPKALEAVTIEVKKGAIGKIKDWLASDNGRLDKLPQQWNSLSNTKRAIYGTVLALASVPFALGGLAPSLVSAIPFIPAAVAQGGAAGAGFSGVGAFLAKTGAIGLMGGGVAEAVISGGRAGKERLDQLLNQNNAEGQSSQEIAEEVVETVEANAELPTAESVEAEEGIKELIEPEVESSLDISLESDPVLERKERKASQVVDLIQKVEKVDLTDIEGADSNEIYRYNQSAGTIEITNTAGDTAIIEAEKFQDILAGCSEETLDKLIDQIKTKYFDETAPQNNDRNNIIGTIDQQRLSLKELQVDVKPVMDFMSSADRLRGRSLERLQNVANYRQNAENIQTSIDIKKPHLDIYRDKLDKYRAEPGIIHPELLAFADLKLNGDATNVYLNTLYDKLNNKVQENKLKAGFNGSFDLNLDFRNWKDPEALKFVSDCLIQVMNKEQNILTQEFMDVNTYQDAVVLEENREQKETSHTFNNIVSDLTKYPEKLTSMGLDNSQAMLGALAHLINSFEKTSSILSNSYFFTRMLNRIAGFLNDSEQTKDLIPFFSQNRYVSGDDIYKAGEFRSVEKIGPKVPFSRQGLTGKVALNTATTAVIQAGSKNLKQND
jgi:hypothetical protein